MSNFTDFDALAAEPAVSLAYLSRASEVSDADVLIIPGTKQTVGDLGWMESEGFVRAIQAHAGRGLTVGVCGGMQMLGAEVIDAAGLEGGGHARGIGLLPIRTLLAKDKVTRRARARLVKPQLFANEMRHTLVSGYEIHLGVTEYEAGAAPLFSLMREGEQQEVADGAASADGRTFGSYLHGLFDDDEFRHAFIQAARAACHLSRPKAFAWVGAERGARFDRLAAHVRGAIDLDSILGWLNLRRGEEPDGR
jgi:adenosylcobyric acid synthase